MNAYDFDKTIYRRDSTAGFYWWCLKRRPRIARRWPALVRAFFRSRRGLMSRSELMETFFEFLLDVPDPRAEAERYWEKHIGRMSRWYLDRKREDDAVLSASPAFLLEPAARRLGIRRLLASPLDPVTARYTGERCHGEGKAKAFLARWPTEKPDAFYSDSLSDAPMAALAREAWLVKGERLERWPAGKRTGGA